jgi:AbrB family looped-hinge helix DNA binding protein
VPDIQIIGQIMETSKVGKRGAIVVPARLRRKFGIEEGGLVVAEERSDGILIRPAVAIPVEIYSPERKAEFLLSNTVDAEDYQAARQEVRKMGIHPSKVPHVKPHKVPRT